MLFLYVSDDFTVKNGLDICMCKKTEMMVIEASAEKKEKERKLGKNQ